ncbi:hypothetical protein ABOZ73_00340 [Caulobacter sp. 73W]|uniref:Uncharacterized protein n=1 Tax=Caulobacter sp. 73W TaxID=3161137 RepID=A0AB39KTI9_9CAUL
MDQFLRTALISITTDFLEGRISPLEAAIALAPFEDDVAPELRECIADMVLVSSETDAIPVGSRRDLWHPDVRAREDEKHDSAQAWAEPMVRATCQRLAAEL